LAVYGKTGDTFRFYELNPQVLELAQKDFTFLSDSDAKIEFVLGDARLSLERESPQKFDLLAIDAFSGDSIPTHLITREAMRLYAQHLSERGAVMFHVSNRYLDLVPVTRQLADVVGMTVARFVDDPPKENPLNRSDWVMVTRNAALAQAFINQKIAEPIVPRKELSPWTDDYNNLFEILK
jgi:spermidine synthase